MKRLLCCLLSIQLASLAAAQDGGSFGSSPKGAPAAAPPKPEPGSKPESGRTEPAPATPTTPAQPANLPSASEIFKRSVEAIGGEDAVRKHTSMRMKGTLAMPAAKMQGPMEILMLAPNRFLTTIEMPGMGTMAQGFDGTVGWSKNPMMGTQLLEGRTLDELRRSADFYKELDPGKLWREATVTGVVDFGGRPCYEIVVKGDLGDGSLFYGVDDGLARGMRLSVESPMGKIPATTRMVEYRNFDGMMVASKTEIEAMGAVQTMTVDSIDFAAIDPKSFELPDDVKALVAGGKKSAPPAGAKPKAPAGAPAPRPVPKPANGGAAGGPAPGTP